MKVENLYDIKSFFDAANIAKTFDGNAGILLPRQLEYIAQTIYQQKYAELTFLQTGIQVNNEGGVAEFITKLKNKIVGDFADAGNSTNTEGKISLETDADSIKVIMKKAFSSWNEIELEQAKLANRNLPAELVAAHNQRYQQLIDKIGYEGKEGNDGLLNFSGFVSSVATNTFANMTGEQMYNEIRDLVNSQRALVSNDPVFSANVVVMPTDVYSLISGTILNTAGGTTTVRQAVETNLGVKTLATFRADGPRVMVAFSNDPRAMVMRIPMPLRVSNIYQKGFESYFESMFRIGGLDVIENQAGYILSGV